MPLPAPLYIDGLPGSVPGSAPTGKASMDVASACGAPKFGQPFEGDPGEYVLTQDFMQLTANFTALALSTAHPDYASYYLTSESALQDMGGGVSKWTRTYCAVPSSRNDYASMSYSFIGYYGDVAIAGVGSGNATAVGRPRNTYAVTGRIQNDYYLIGVSPPAAYTAVNLIPSILDQKYYWPQGRNVGGVWVPTFTPGSAADIAAGTATDDIWDPAVWSSVVPTIPSRATYQGWINAGTEIVAAASVVSRWKGNIFQRQTRYVIAQ